MSGWFFSIVETSIFGFSFSASIPQCLTYLRRCSHGTFLPFASDLQEAIACFSAAFSAAVGAAAKAPALPIVMATASENTYLVKRNVIAALQLASSIGR